MKKRIRKPNLKKAHFDDCYIGLDETGDKSADACFVYIGGRHYMNSAQIHLNREEVKYIYKKLEKVIKWMDQ